MTAEPDWDQRAALCRARLQFLHFLVGRWEGEGQTQDLPVTGRFEARLRFDDSFVQCEETLLDAECGLVHEDCAFLRYDPEAELVRVTHYMAHAWVGDQIVQPLPGGPGAQWYAGPFAPRVELLPQGPQALEIRVWLPEGTTPDTHIRYRRVPEALRPDALRPDALGPDALTPDR